MLKQLTQNINKSPIFYSSMTVGYSMYYYYLLPKLIENKKKYSIYII
jgi:hypothetical protein